MTEKKVLVTIQVMEDGKCIPLDAERRPLEEISGEYLGKTLQGKTINEATILPKMTLLRSNPKWLNLDGRWYYIP